MKWVCLRGMAEDRTSTVEQPIASELDAGLDDPSEGTEVVVRDIGDEEGVVGVQRSGRR